MTIDAFGLNLPNIGQQDKLVVPDGIPNLTGLALGFGGATSEMRTVLKLALIAVIIGWSIWTWRTRRWLTPCGWASLALVVTLSWTLPWYIAWLLPFAALARARWLRVAAAVLGVYIYLAWMPYSTEILGFLHVNPANPARPAGADVHELVAVLRGELLVSSPAGQAPTRSCSRPSPSPSPRSAPTPSGSPASAEELALGFVALAGSGTAVSVFGSARTPPAIRPTIGRGPSRRELGAGGASP